MLIVTENRQAQWLFTLFIAKYDRHSVRHLVFSSDEKMFASILDENVYVCDSETGHLILGSFELKYHLWS